MVVAMGAVVVVAMVGMGVVLRGDDVLMVGVTAYILGPLLVWKQRG